MAVERQILFCKAVPDTFKAVGLAVERQILFCKAVPDTFTVHVGHKIDFKALGFPSLSRFHSRVERDIGRLAKTANIQLPKPKAVSIDRKYLFGIARETYQNSFLELPEVYGEANPDGLEKMVSQVLTAAVQHTADVWHTILFRTGMTKRKWSMQPLL